MSADEALLAQMLEDGRTAVKRIEKLTEVPEADALVCFHFTCPKDQAQDLWEEDAECVRLSRPLFAALPFELEVAAHGGCIGIEAWERVRPTVAWLHDRLPRMIELARHSEMRFEGWSFEPVGGPIISAGVNVMSAQSAEGSETMEGLIEAFQAKKH